MFNSGPINSSALNAESSPMVIVASGLLLSIEQSIASTESGNLLSLTQMVGYVASGNLASIEQEILLRLSGSGLIIDVEQEVSNAGLGKLITLEQRVVDTSIADHVTRNGWDLVITLAGNIIPTNQIHGSVSVARSESQASLANFTIIPPLGLQSVDYYAGKPVTIDVLTPTGTKRIYTGVVDIPELDLVDKKISIRCTDRRTELVNAQLGSVIGSIGYFSPIIFQTVKDTAEELDKRLSTTPYSVDFDVFGNYTLTSWFPKATADYTLTDEDIYLERPIVELASRGRITNKITIDFQYRYERLHHMQRSYRWTSPIASSVNLLLQYSYSLTFKSDVLDAIKAAGWPIRGEITFTPIWPSGWYGGRAWSTVSYIGQIVDKVDSSGNLVLDASGNPVKEQRISGGTDNGPLYCMGATWNATTRWTQTLTESYSLVVQASQSVAQYGAIEQGETYSADASFETKDWEDYTKYDNNAGQAAISYYINKDTNRLDFSVAVSTALNKARTTILAAHRDTKVTVRKFLWPEIDLKHTVRINTDAVQTKGKVFSINHVMDIGTGEAYTEISISLFKAQGASSDSSYIAHPIAADAVTYPTSTITLGNHFGEDPTTEAARSWNGMIGNRFPPGGLARTRYTDQFIVDTPPIPDALRNEKIKSASNTYNVSIPDDSLTIVF